ncbi:methyltransferase [Streptomyces phage TurkishDelight]|uniref:DNA (cytosine-5-)-methyltransferase n=1 Tax=Streptomyces phage TurkishDelight TaxID=2793708 RepID=A0A7T0Q4H3_9CAUD|nr:methyltransferase [Streptomyces phage TurkishDelight]QPL14152.1 methyltransferase [Streptomyces phage TurkishDelight]
MSPRHRPRARRAGTAPAAATVDKPAYRVPCMDEIAALGWNGFNGVTTFSGCGGSSLGYRMAGFRMRWASEFIPAAQETYRANAAPYTVLDGRDIREVTAADICAATGLAVGEVDLYDGSPPCAAFSSMGSREAGWGKVKAYSDTVQRVDDLFFEYARILKELQPRTFVAENVSGLIKGTAKGYFLEILAALKACGYRVEARLLDASRLGVPQSRQRLIFVGVREDLDMAPVFPRPLPYQYTVRDALPAVPRLVHDTSGDRGQGDVTDKPSPAITVGTDAINSYHFRVLDPAEGQEITHDPETGKNIHIGRYAIGEAWRDTPRGGSSERFFSLKRLDPDKPSQTISAEGGNVTKASVTHYAEARKLTLAELRRIGGFPDDFVLTGTYEQRWERIGRAVPPVMMSHIAAAVRDRVLYPLRERGVI